MTTPFGLSQDLARGRIGINSELRVHHVARTVGRRGYSRLQTEEVMWRRIGWEGAGLWRRVGYEGGLCDFPLPQVGKGANSPSRATERFQSTHWQV